MTQIGIIPLSSFPEFEHLRFCTQFIKEIQTVQSGANCAKHLQKWLRDRFLELNDPEGDIADLCLSTPRTYEHIDGKIFAITYRNKEKNIRILFYNHSSKKVDFLLCAFSEKKDHSDYKRFVPTAKKRVREFLEGE